VLHVLDHGIPWFLRQIPARGLWSWLVEPIDRDF
jgi:hypothetical protein